MRAFLLSIAAIIVVAIVSVFALGALQKSSGLAYSTPGTRVSSSSYLRRMAQASMEKVGLKTKATNSGLNVGGMTGQQGEDTCQEVSAWQAIFIDFGNQSEDEVACGSSS
jgi:hypothetical protein